MYAQGARSQAPRRNGSLILIEAMGFGAAIQGSETQLFRRAEIQSKYTFDMYVSGSMANKFSKATISS